jgi:hypothetical protein
MTSKQEARAIIKRSDYSGAAEKLLNRLVSLTHRGKDFDNAEIQIAAKFEALCRNLKTSERQIERVLETLKQDGTLEWTRTKGLLRCRLIFNALSARAEDSKESAREKKTAETTRKEDRAAKAREAYATRRRASKDLMFEIILALISDNVRRNRQTKPAMTGGNQ